MPTVNELNERLSSTLSLHDKMSLISSYVLDYDEKSKDEEVNDDLYLILYEAKKSIVEFLNYNKSELDVLVDEDLMRKFLLNPIEALENHYLSKKAQMIIRQEDDTPLFEKVSNMGRILHDEENKYKDYENKKGNPWMTFVERRKNTLIEFVSNKLEKPIDETIKDNKPGMFEKLFRKTSDEYNELLSAINDFNNHRLVDYGNVRLLEAATKNYVKHKFPSYDGISDNPSFEGLDKLNSKSKGRIIFCKAILEGINELKEKERLEEPNDSLSFNGNQENFHDELNKNLESSNENLIDDLDMSMNSN